MSTAAKPFDMSQMAMGGLGQMFDSVEMVKRAWSSLSLPSSLVPTVDLDELDKRIADLKAVEQWLNMNLGMLHGTIQGLEIQRGTLAAVKAFGASMAEPARGGESPDPTAAAQQRARAAVDAMQRAVNASGGSRPAGHPSRTASGAPAGAAEEADPPASAEEAPEVDAGEAAARPGGATAAAAGNSATAGELLAGLDSAAWWKLLQHNFNQVAEAALAGVGLPGATGAGGTGSAAAGGKAGSKPRGKTGGKPSGTSPERSSTARRRATAGKPAGSRKQAAKR